MRVYFYTYLRRVKIIINPIVEKELKTKMRGWKSPILITVYLLIISAIGCISLYGVTLRNYQFFPSSVTDIFIAVSVTQFIIILIICPALTATSISGERERQTLDLLLCTDFSARKIIIGKIISSIVHVTFLLILSLPLLGVAILFGGITIWDILRLFSFYIMTSLMVASIGIFYSSIFKKSITSVIFSYLTVGGIVGGTLILREILREFTRYNDNYMVLRDKIDFVLLGNPILGFTNILNGINPRFNITGNDTFDYTTWQPLLSNVYVFLAITVFAITFAAFKIEPTKSIFSKRVKPINKQIESIIERNLGGNNEENSAS